MTHIITSAKVNYLMLIDNNFQYPAMLKVAGKHCVIIGGGTVAARKLQTLLDAGARVTVVAPEFCAEVQSLAGSAASTVSFSAAPAARPADARSPRVRAADTAGIRLTVRG